jgi:hypothetical protein
MKYSPDQWQLVKVLGKTPHYRVFGSWSGGYLDGDSWRLNSGISEVKETETGYDLIGYSGSVYRVSTSNYGIKSPYNTSELFRICEGGMCEVVDDMPDMKEFAKKL